MTDTPAPGARPTPTVPPAGEAAVPPSRPEPGATPAPGGKKVDLAGLAAAMRSIERGENPAAPAPRGDAADARRKRREAMAAEAAAMQAAESAAAAGLPAAAPTDAADPSAPDQGEAAPADSLTAAGSDTADPNEGEAGRTAAAQALASSAAGEADAAGTDEPGRTAAAIAGAANRVEPVPEAASAHPEDSSGLAGPGESAGGAAGSGPDGADAARLRGAGVPNAGAPGRVGAVPDAAGAHREDGSGPAGPGGPGGSALGGAAADSRGGGTARPGGAPGSAGSKAPAAPGTPGRVGAAGTAVGREVLDADVVEGVRVVLVEGGAPGGFAPAAVRALGEGAAAELRGDPWLVLGLDGVRVEVDQADAFARAVLGADCGPGDERRVRALVGHLMEKAAEQGHTALGAEPLKAALARHAVPDPDAALATAVEEAQLLVFRAESDAQSDQDGEEDDEAAPVALMFGLDRYALAEESLADDCVRLLRSFEGDAVDWEQAAADAPSPSAAELIRSAAAHALVLHTGGEAARAEPTALVAAARAAGLRAYAAAYTENGRRRLAATLGEEAALTVQGLLAGGRAADGSLPLDLLAVLDAPQLSVEEAATLVEAVPDGARLVLSGDPHALWSAGPGRAFADLLASKACPRVTSRTPDPGPIGELTSCVGEGELAPVDAPDKEVVVVPVHDPREAVHRTVQLVADSVPRAFGVPPEQTQVVTPAHGGPAGTRALNAALKERLNPGPGRFGGFDPGDRVVYVPSPGRTHPGTVVGAEQDGLRLACEQGPVLVPREEVAATVRHGWAITGHQAAGMRWPAAVVVVPGDTGALLTRSWVYTAFARGERHLSVVQGADQGLAQAVAGPAAKERTTRLASVLRELAAES